MAEGPLHETVEAREIDGVLLGRSGPELKDVRDHFRPGPKGAGRNIEAPEAPEAGFDQDGEVAVVTSAAGGQDALMKVAD